MNYVYIYLSNAGKEKTDRVIPVPVMLIIVCGGVDFLHNTGEFRKNRI